MSSSRSFTRSPDGMPIAYRTHGTGSGPIVLLIMGLGMPGANWLEVPERLGRVGYRVVTFDHRGTGASGPERRWPHPRELARDALAVLDAVTTEQAFVAGISMGGMVAQHLALEFPSRVAGLLLIGTTAGGRDLVPPSLRTLGLLMSLAFRPPRPSDARMLELLGARSEDAEGLARRGSSLRSEPTSLRTHLAHASAVARHRVGPRLAALECPVHLVHGEHDRLVVPQNTVRLAMCMPFATLTLVPELGHAVAATRPAVVVEALAYLARRHAMAHAREHRDSGIEALAPNVDVDPDDQSEHPAMGWGRR